MTEYTAVYDDGTPYKTTPAAIHVLWYRLRWIDGIQQRRMEVDYAKRQIIVTR